MAKLPNGEKAVVDIRKLVEYVLNPFHEKKGKDKARLYSSMLDMRVEHAAMLRDAILEAARNEEAVLSDYNTFGPTYKLTFLLTGPTGRTAFVTTRWIYDPGSDIPRFTSGWPLTDE